MLIQHYVPELAFPGWEKSSCGGKKWPQILLCVQGAEKVPLPVVTKAFGEGIFSKHICTCACELSESLYF